MNERSTHLGRGLDADEDLYGDGQLHKISANSNVSILLLNNHEGTSSFS